MQTKIDTARLHLVMPGTRRFPDIGVVGGISFGKVEWMEMDEVEKVVSAFFVVNGWSGAGEKQNITRFFTFRPSYFWGGTGDFRWISTSDGSDDGILFSDDIGRCNFFPNTGNQKVYVLSQWGKVVISAALLGVTSLEPMADSSGLIRGRLWNTDLDPILLAFKSGELVRADSKK